MTLKVISCNIFEMMNVPTISLTVVFFPVIFLCRFAMKCRTGKRFCLLLQHAVGLLHSRCFDLSEENTGGH